VHWKARGLDFSKMFHKVDAPHEAVHWTSGRSTRSTMYSIAS
jgi:hypothetical protein